MDLKTWWVGLHHNWKKILLVNFDLNLLFKNQHKLIEKEIIVLGPYNAYFKYFNIGIRARLDKFKASENEILKIINMENLFLGYSGLQDLNLLKNFQNLKNLTVYGFLSKDLSELKHCQKLEYLKVGSHHLESISKDLILENLIEIEFVYCYNLTDIDQLNRQPNLKIVDLSYLGYHVVNFTALKEIKKLDKILIQHRQISYHQEANTLPKKTQYIALEKSNLEQIDSRNSEKNYYSYFIESQEFELIKQEFVIWTIKKIEK